MAQREFEVLFTGMICVKAETKEQAEAKIEAILWDAYFYQIDGIVDVTDKPRLRH
jgi:hypothetical protein